MSVENIFAVQTGGCPSYEDIVKLPNKVLLWCGKTRSILIKLKEEKNNSFCDYLGSSQ